MAAAAAAAAVLKPTSMAGISGALFTTKPRHPFSLGFPPKPSKPLHLHLALKLRSTPLNWPQTPDAAVDDLDADEEAGLEGGLEAAGEPEGDEFVSGDEEAGWEGGLEAAGEPEGDEFVSGDEEGGFPEPPEGAKLFVGNLPFDVDSEKLAKVFERAGVVEISEVIYDRETDRSRGFGFVTMSTVEEAEKAVGMFHRYDVGGRLLTVNIAAPRGTRPERSQESEPSYKVYAGNLPWQIDDDRLAQLFSAHGKVLDARVVLDRETGRSRGFGFVQMASKAELDDAIAALDGQSIDGRALRVNVAEERPRRNF